MFELLFYGGRKRQVSLLQIEKNVIILHRILFYNFYNIANKKMNKLNDMVYIHSIIIDRQNEFSIFSFLNLYSGFLANSVDPDQPASEEAG